MAVLYPGAENFAEVYHQLEELAGGPRGVSTTTDGPSLGLVVSDEVYHRWLEANGVASSEETEAPKKRPGRPRKSQES